jgi:cell division septation protein DedD
MASGMWRIQLGAFSQRGSAEALFKKLAGSGAVAGRQAFYVPAGAVTRLQVGPFESRAAAQAACNALKQACFPVSAK